MTGWWLVSEVMLGEFRTLPIRLEPAPGEALDSWLLRLAHRYDIPAVELQFSG
jgi:hypothetical protein